MIANICQIRYRQSPATLPAVFANHVDLKSFIRARG